MPHKPFRKLLCFVLSLSILLGQTICAAELTLPLVSISSPVSATPLIPSLPQSPPAGSLQNTNHFVMNQSAGGKFPGVSPVGIYDGLGSVRQITDAAGTVIESYDYDVYGQPTTVSAVGNPVMFTGWWFDSESGLYYYRARYYSPTLGRFLQRDPIGYLSGMNLYAYVKNNPVNRTDPSGLILVDMTAFDPGFDPAYEEYQRERREQALYDIEHPNPCDKKPIIRPEEPSTFDQISWGIGMRGLGAIPNWSIRWKGGEITLTRPGAPTPDWRFNPLGSRGSQNPYGRRPHYHRRPGIEKHRPWERGW